MNNKKSTKRTLTTSILSLVLCIALLIGTTFAWFTDSVTSGNNKIQAGTLKVDLELLDEETNQWNSIKDSKKAIFDYDKWEPGYTEVKVLKVVNKGTLALKWQAQFVSKYTLTDLANVIDVYVKEDVDTIPTDRTAVTGENGWTKVGTVKDFVNTIATTTTGELAANASETLGIALKMQESAGNEYQGMDLGGAFDIMIMATQLTSEKDSFNNQYDKDATYTAEIDALRAKLAAAQSGDTVEYSLTHDAYVSEEVTIPNGVKLVLDGAGNTVYADTTGIVFNGSNIELKNLTIEGDAKHVLKRVGGSAVLTNVTVNMDGNWPVLFYGGGEAVLNNSTITGKHDDSVYAYANVWVGDGGTLTVNGGNYGSIFVNASNGGGGTNAGKIVVNSGTIDKVTLETCNGMNATLVNEGGTVNNVIRIVDSASVLQTTISNATAGDTIMILKDIADTAVTVDKSLTITGDKTLNNVSITASSTGVELTVSELNFTGNSWINANNAKKLTVSGVTANVAPVNGSGTANNATTSRSAFIALGSNERSTLELVVENCNIVVPPSTDAVLGWAQITKATITGNTFGSEDAHIKKGPNGIADAVKVMSIADGAVFTITGNTAYCDSNGFAFYQNTTRDNAYTVVVDNNTFYGSADHIWVEVGGTTTTKATIKATSNNTVNGKTFTAADIKSSRSVATMTSYAGVDVVTDENGKLIGGTFTAKSNMDLVADGYVASQNADGTYTVVAQ